MHIFCQGQDAKALHCLLISWDFLNELYCEEVEDEFFMDFMNLHSHLFIIYEPHDSEVLYAGCTLENQDSIELRFVQHEMQEFSSTVEYKFWSHCFDSSLNTICIEFSYSVVMRSTK